MAEEDEEPPGVSRELFAARHELLTIKTMAEQGRSAGRSSWIALPHPRAWTCEGPARTVRDRRPHQRLTVTFLISVTEFYRAPTDTKMTIAAGRLASSRRSPSRSLISPVMGMNVIVNDSTRWILLTISQTGLVVISRH
jgi:magnesium transporter